MLVMLALASTVADDSLSKLWRYGLDRRTAEWVEKTAGPSGSKGRDQSFAACRGLGVFVIVVSCGAGIEEVDRLFS